MSIYAPKKKQSHKIHKKKLTRLMQILKMHARMQNIITQTHISKKKNTQSYKSEANKNIRLTLTSKKHVITKCTTNNHTKIT